MFYLQLEEINSLEKFSSVYSRLEDSNLLDKVYIMNIVDPRVVDFRFIEYLQKSHFIKLSLSRMSGISKEELSDKLEDLVIDLKATDKKIFVDYQDCDIELVKLFLDWVSTYRLDIIDILSIDDPSLSKPTVDKIGVLREIFEKDLSDAKKFHPIDFSQQITIDSSLDLLDYKRNCLGNLEDVNLIKAFLEVESPFDFNKLLEFNNLDGVIDFTLDLYSPLLYVAWSGGDICDKIISFKYNVLESLLMMGREEILQLDISVGKILAEVGYIPYEMIAKIMVCEDEYFQNPVVYKAIKSQMKYVKKKG